MKSGVLPAATAVELPMWADLAAAIRTAWTAETSASRSWTAARPSVGQCAVTALIVQDLHGGVLLRAVVSGESHYWNRLPDGQEVDLTADQFDEFRLDGPTEVRSRDYVLSFPDSASRYELLKSSVLAQLGRA